MKNASIGVRGQFCLLTCGSDGLDGRNECPMFLYLGGADGALGPILGPRGARHRSRTLMMAICSAPSGLPPMGMRAWSPIPEMRLTRVLPG